MLKRLRSLFQRPLPACLWSIAIHEGQIAIDDGRGTKVDLAIESLSMVVVATDDSGPWGDDVIFLLYADGLEPIGLFPLEAKGCQDFVGWLSTLPGYDENGFVKAIASTQVAQFKIFDAQKSD